MERKRGRRDNLERIGNFRTEKEREKRERRGNLRAEKESERESQSRLMSVVVVVDGSLSIVDFCQFRNRDPDN